MGWIDTYLLDLHIEEGANSRELTQVMGHDWFLVQLKKEWRACAHGYSLYERTSSRGQAIGVWMENDTEANLENVPLPYLTDWVLDSSGSNELIHNHSFVAQCPMSGNPNPIAEVNYTSASLHRNLSSQYEVPPFLLITAWFRITVTTSMMLTFVAKLATRIPPSVSPRTEL